MKRSRPTSISINSRSRPRPHRIDSVGRLRELQALMAGAIMRPLASGDRMEKSSGRTANAIIKPNDRLTSFERLEIYNRQYWFRVLDCFYDDYPGLRAVIGQRKFDRLARAYLAKYPSASFSLRNLGSRLEKFLRREPQWIDPHRRLALDMARIEWAHIVAFDEGARTVVHVDELLGRDPATIRLGLQPYVTLLDVEYPVDDLVLAAKQGDERLRGEASNAVEIHSRHTTRLNVRGLKPKQQYLAVHRMNCSVYYKSLTREQYEVLRAIARGATLERACAVLLRRRGAAATTVAAEVQKWFQAWSSFGWFCHR
ncbi:MAG TPA: DNA-binding domain-containing protein [Verrucomicrobiae bacterium]|nr:DNA-binding domain-containing protein [Verrucomicrobiae bacterium]